MEPRIRAYAQQAAAELPLGSPVDFIESFALRVPASVIGELLGLEASLHSRFKRWSAAPGHRELRHQVVHDRGAVQVRPRLGRDLGVRGTTLTPCKRRVHLLLGSSW